MGVAQPTLFANRRALARAQDRGSTSRHGRRRAGRLHDARRPHDDAEGRSRVHLAASPTRQRVLVHPRRDVTPAAGDYPTGSGATRARVRDRHGARDPRALPRCFLDFDIKQTAPLVEPTRRRWRRCSPSSGGSTASSSPRSSTRHRGVRQVAPDVHLGGDPRTPNSGGPSTREGRCRSSGPSACRCPSTSVTSWVVDEKFVTAAHGRPGGASGRSTTPSRWVALRPRVDGIISDVPSVLAGVLAERDAMAAGRLARRRRTGLAAPAVRTLAVVGLLLRPDLRLLVRLT